MSQDTKGYFLSRKTGDATGVNCSLRCVLFSEGEDNLIVVQAHALVAYTIKRDTNASGEEGAHFEHRATFRFPAPILSAAAARLQGETRDTLFLTFADAKVSVVQYEPSTNDLKTLSMHAFEEDELTEGRWSSPSTSPVAARPVVKIDPLQRCAAMLLYRKRLVIIPLTREEVLTEEGATSSRQVFRSFIVRCESLAVPCNHVVDFEWLCGYNEPTLLLLNETFPINPGRYVAQKDVMSAVAVSVSQARQPVIWNHEALPNDAYKIIAVPMPLGGAVVVCANTLGYISQSKLLLTPVNSLAGLCTKHALDAQSSLSITSSDAEGQPPVRALDAAHVAFVKNTHLLIALKNGELLLVKLLTSGRHMDRFQFLQCPPVVLTSTLTVLSHDHLFVGSRLGNSMLLRFEEEMHGDGAFEPKMKRGRVESQTSLDADDLLYGGHYESREPTQTSSTYKFKLLDSLVNIGPCGNHTIGMSADEPVEFDEQEKNNKFELVLCSGHGKNGSLCVLHRSVRPQVTMSTDVLGASKGVWTTYGPDSWVEGYTEPFHSYMFVSQEASTMILSTAGSSLDPLAESDFYTGAPTLFAGNLAPDFVVQIVPQMIGLFRNAKMLHEVPLDEANQAVQVTQTTALICIRFSSGNVTFATVEGPEAEGRNHALRLAEPNFKLSKGDSIVSCALFADRSKIFEVFDESRTDIAPELALSGQDSQVAVAPVSPTKTSQPVTLEDDDDFLLYGNPTSAKESVPAAPAAIPERTESGSAFAPDAPAKDDKGPILAVVGTRLGELRIYEVALHDLESPILRFSCQALNLAPRLLTDTILEHKDEQMERKENPNDPVIKEVGIFALGDGMRPLLVARLQSGQLLAYQAFLFAGQAASQRQKWNGRLMVRFQRFELDVLLQEPMAYVHARKRDAAEGKAAKVSAPEQQLRFFEDINGYDGIFVCGENPVWVMCHRRLKTVVAHRMQTNETVHHFTEFHNPICSHGFVYFNSKGIMRVAMLPDMNYSLPWAVRRIPLRKTPKFIAFHEETSIYALVTTEKKPNLDAPRTTNHEVDPTPLVKDPKFVYPEEDKFALQLVSPQGWEIIPKSEIELKPHEHITSCKIMKLHSEEHSSGFHNFIVACTTFVHTEEVNGIGRLLVYDIIEVMPEPGLPTTKHKLKLLCELTEKGSFTAIEEICGYVAGCIGRRDGDKVFVWRLMDREKLTSIAYAEGLMYSVTLSAIKTFLVVGDLRSSIQVFQFHEGNVEEGSFLIRIGRDPIPLSVYSTSFVVHNEQLRFVATDCLGNFVILGHTPRESKAEGGRVLSRIADFNTNTRMVCLQQIRCMALRPRPGAAPVRSQRHYNWYATLQGGTGILMPLEEMTFKRLDALQTRLNVGLRHRAGLNPRAAHTFVTERPNINGPKGSVLDGDLLWRYVWLSVTDQRDFARRIGSSPEQILEDLLDVQRCTAHF